MSSHFFLCSIFILKCSICTLSFTFVSSSCLCGPSQFLDIFPLCWTMILSRLFNFVKAAQVLNCCLLRLVLSPVNLVKKETPPCCEHCFLQRKSQLCLVDRLISRSRELSCWLQLLLVCTVAVLQRRIHTVLSSLYIIFRYEPFDVYLWAEKCLCLPVWLLWQQTAAIVRLVFSSPSEFHSDRLLSR